MSWTFPTDVEQEEIEACLELMKAWDELDGGFIDSLVFAVHYHGVDGDDHYMMRTITGEARLLTLLGLLEACKIDVMRNQADGPFAGFVEED